MRLGAATVAFIAVVTAIGYVTKQFGVEAGLLALVLALVALVVAPYVYLPAGPAAEDTEDTEDTTR